MAATTRRKPHAAEKTPLYGIFVVLAPDEAF